MDSGSVHPGAGSVSVVLPTREWTAACGELAAQVSPDDEFIVVADRPDDPVVVEAAGTPADVVVAGEPERCSAKCNALAAGLERAGGDRLVCTDADFEHGDAWLDRVLARLADAPPDHAVSTVPVVLSEGGPMRALEGPAVLASAVTLATNATAWGGTMAFRRDAIDLDAYVRDLRRTVSDDALLTDRVAGVVSVPSLARAMPVSGGVREGLNRQVRWVRTGLYADPGALAAGAAMPVGVLAGLLVAPLVVAALVTLAAGLAYAALGVRRWTFLLTAPAYPLGLVFLAWGLAREEFVWTGRRYRWAGLYDVEVLDRDVDAESG